MIKRESAIERTEYAEKYGIEMACKKFGVSPDSLVRYKFIARSKARARILLLDIETAPMEAYIWSKGKIYVNPHQIIKDWFVLTWSAKWLCESKVISEKVTRKEALARDDKRIIEGMWGLLDKADIVIAQNGDRFDLPRLNARFLKHGLKRPSPYKTIDTLKILWKNFALTSNGLDEVCKFLKIPGKVDTGGFELWKKCVKGDASALKKMEQYNKNDVIILENVYFALRPYIPNHPNLGLFVDADEDICPNCGSVSLKWGGFYQTRVNIYHAFRCKDCGSIGRARKSALDKDEKRSLTVGV
jgi:DNA polymerase III epsilon subunit-like protein